MKTRNMAMLLTLAWTGLVSSAYAQGEGASVLKLPQDIEFKGPATGAPQTAILYGDPTKPGVFVTRVKFSAGWKDPPHWHPDEVRTVGCCLERSTSPLATNGMKASSRHTPRARSIPSHPRLRITRGPKMAK